MVGRDTKFWVLAAAFLACACGGKDGGGEDNGILRPGVSPTVRGAVRDADGKGLPGAVVEARNPGGGSLIHSDTTDASGSFVLVLQGFTLGRQIELRASRPGFRDTSRTVLIENSETIGLFLTLARAGVTFLGQATDVLAGGAPLAGVDVTVRRADGSAVQTAVTDARGEYATAVNATAGETFVLDAVRVGFAPRRDTVVVQRDTVVVDFPLSLAIVGEVKDTRGRPVQNAVVTTVGGTAEGSVVVGAEGRYVLTLKQDAGGDTVLVRASGFFEARQWVPFSRTAENRADFQLAPVLDPVPQVAPQALAFGLIGERDTLRVSNAAEEGGLTWSVLEAPAWLSVEPAEGSVRAGQGARDLVVTLMRDRIPAGGEAEVSGRVRLGFNSTGVPSLEVPVSVRRRSVAGQVRDVAGRAVAGAAVSLGTGIEDLSPVASGTSVEDGRFALRLVPDGDYMLTVRAEGHLAAAERVTISGGQEVFRDLALIPFPAPAEMVYESDVPYRVLIDPAGDGDRAYVLVRTSPPDNLIKVVSGLSVGQGRTSRARDLRVGANPTDGAFYENFLAVACYGDTAVWTVDLNTDAKARIPTSPGPFGLTVAGSRAYVACEGAGGNGVLDVVDLEARAVVERVTLGELVASLGGEPWGPDASVSGNRAFITDNQEAGRVVVVDLSGSPPQVVSSLNVGGRPQAIAELPEGLQSFVLNKRDPAGVTVIDRLSGEKVRTITVSDPPDFPRALALSPDPFFGRRLLYIVYSQDLVVYDLEQSAEVGRFRFTEDATAQAVSAAVTPDGMGLLIGLERAQMGRRLLFFRFGS